MYVGRCVNFDPHTVPSSTSTNHPSTEPPAGLFLGLTLSRIETPIGEDREPVAVQWVFRTPSKHSATCYLRQTSSQYQPGPEVTRGPAHSRSWRLTLSELRHRRHRQLSAGVPLGA